MKSHMIEKMTNVLKLYRNIKQQQKKIRKRQTKKIRKRQKKIRNAKSSNIQFSIEMQISKIFTQRFFTRNFTRRLTSFISSFDENDFFSFVIERDFNYFNCIEFSIT